MSVSFRPKRNHPASIISTGRPGAHVRFHASTGLSEHEFLDLYYAKTTNSLWIFLVFLARFMPPFCKKAQESLLPFIDNTLSVCRIDVLVQNNWTFEQMANLTRPPDGFCSYYDLDYNLVKGMTYKEVEEAIEDDPRFLDYKDKEMVAIKRCKKMIDKKQDYSLNMSRSLGVYCDGNKFFRTIRRRRKIGYAFGGIISGMLADLFGRRTVGITASVLWCVLSFAALGMSSAFSRKINQIFVSALGISVCITSYITLTELSHTDVRYLTMFTDFGFVLGDIFCLYLRNRIVYWKHLEFILACCLISNIFVCWYIMESPRWLLNKRRKTEAYMCLIELGCSSEVLSFEHHDSYDFKPKTFKNMWEYLIRKRTKHFFILVILSFSSETLFYFTIHGADLTTSFPNANTMKMVFLMCEITSFLYFIPFYVFFGKRLSLFISFLIRAICLFMILVLRELNTLPEDFIFLTFDSMQRMAIRVILSLYVAQFFPTFVRATILGMLYSALGICGLIVDVVWMSLHTTPQRLLDFTAVLLSVCGFLVLMLPETKRTELPNQKIFYISN